MFRKGVKRLLLLLAVIPVAPLAAASRLGQAAGSDRMFNTAAQGLSLIPGSVGSFLRLAFYKCTLQRIGSDVKIGFGSFFSKSTAVAGNRINIGGYCILGDVEIGDGVLIASRVSILSGKYEHGSAFAPVMTTGGGRIRIGAGSWIGEAAVVAADVGANCLVAAGAVVTREVADSHLAAGNPAKQIRIQPFLSVVPGGRERETAGPTGFA